MKHNRIIAIFMLVIILFTFSCCGKNEDDPFGKTDSTVITTTGKNDLTNASVIDGSTTEKGKTLYATATVNVREEPNTECKIVGKLTTGESIELVEHLDNGWSVVKYGSERRYISTQYLSEKKPANESDFADPLAEERIVVDPTEGNPYLVVVNAKRAANETYKPELSEIFDTGYYMEVGVTPYYEEMYTAAKKDGITLTPYSAYRSYERQKNNYINLTKQYMSQYKLSEEEAAKKEAAAWRHYHLICVP